MWLFNSKSASLGETGFFSGFEDWHSHILPGVDDGFKTMEQSLEALEFYSSLGLRKLWLTPHIMEDYPNETSFLRQRFEELKNEWKGDVELHLASENMLDSLFEKRLKDKDFLPIADDGSHLLVETSYFNAPMRFHDILRETLSAGYFPLLAHPERYRYMKEDDYRKLRDMGIKFQVNFVSLVGGYGETARKKAEWLLKEGMVEAVGSDLHKLSVLRNVLSMRLSSGKLMERLLQVAGNPEVI